MTEQPQRKSALVLMFQAPANHRPEIDVNAFAGISSLDDRKTWMEAMYRFNQPVGSIDDVPPIRTITLCGSGRFRRHYIEWNAKLTAMGFLVFPIGNFAAGNILERPSPVEKATVDAVHFAKIRASDAIVVIDAKVDGKPYIGESTAREIEWAEQLGKAIFYTGDMTGWEYTKPAPDFWGAYSEDCREEKARFLQSVLDGLYKRTPAAALARSNSVYCDGFHDEYGWSSIDENDIAENADEFTVGSRHIVTFMGDITEAVLVIDRNELDPHLGRQVVNWHLEPLGDEEKAKVTAEIFAAAAAEPAKTDKPGEPTAAPIAAEGGK